MFLAVAAPCGFDEEPHALFGDWFVQETVDRAVRDLRGQRTLVVNSAGDDQDEVRKLCLQPVGELLNRAGDRGCVDYGDAGMFANELSGEIGFRADGENVVVRPEDLQRLYKRAIVTEHDQALARHDFYPWKGTHRHGLSEFLKG